MSDVRVDTGVEPGAVISPFYDSMIAKLITHGATRDDAADDMIAALRHDLEVAGPRVNTAFLCALLENADVRALRMDTGLIGRDLAELTRSRIGTPQILAAVQRLLLPAADHRGPWSALDGFQIGRARTLAVPLVVNGVPRTFSVTWPGNAIPHVSIAGETATVAEQPDACIDVPGGLYALFEGEQVEIRWPTYDADALDDGEVGDAVRAPINGKVARVFVKTGDAIVKGDRLAVVEAMKMEHVLLAVRDGVVAGIAVSEGQQVNQGTLLVSLEPSVGLETAVQSAEAAS